MYRYTLPYPWLLHLHVHACPRMLYIFVTNLISFLETLSDVLANTKCHQLHACVDYNTCSCTWDIAVQGIWMYMGYSCSWDIAVHGICKAACLLLYSLKLDITFHHLKGLSKRS